MLLLRRLLRERLRDLVLIRQVCAYTLVMSTLGLAVFGLTDQLVRQAEMHVAKLMLVGDHSSSTGSSEIGITTASTVLEADAWMQNIKSQFQAKDRSRPQSSSTNGGGLFGLGGKDLLAPDLDPLTSGKGASTGRNGTHRTMCVRLCDGYFWPVSFATSPDQFERDQATCESSCSSPAKLYTYENPGQELEQMVSLKGQPYAKLSVAFLFRTKLDQSCKCNPHPWEKEAMDRHRKYAEDAAKKKLLRQAELDLAPSPTAKRNKSAKGATAAKLGTPIVAKPERKASIPALIETTGANQKSPAIQYATLNAATVDVPAQAIVTASSTTQVTEVLALDPAAPRAKPKSGVQTRLKANLGQSEQTPTARRPLATEAKRMQLGAGTTTTSTPQQPSGAKRDWRTAVFAER